MRPLGRTTDARGPSRLLDRPTRRSLPLLPPSGAGRIGALGLSSLVARPRAVREPASAFRVGVESVADEDGALARWDLLSIRHPRSTTASPLRRARGVALARRASAGGAARVAARAVAPAAADEVEMRLRYRAAAAAERRRGAGTRARLARRRGEGRRRRGGGGGRVRGRAPYPCPARPLLYLPETVAGRRTGRSATTRDDGAARPCSCSTPRSRRARSASAPPRASDDTHPDTARRRRPPWPLVGDGDRASRSRIRRTSCS